MPVLHSSNHLDILHQGVDNWNQWRERNPDVVPQLDGTYFPPEIYTGINLRGASLRGAEFDETYLRLADFTGAVLDEALFMHARLDATSFESASLEDAQLVCVNLEEANLDVANLHKCDFSRSNMRAASFVGSDLTSANLSFCQLADANFKFANLSGACIQVWAVTAGTCFENVECSHLFRNARPELPVNRLPGVSFPGSGFTLGERSSRLEPHAGCDEADLSRSFAPAIDAQTLLDPLAGNNQCFRDHRFSDRIPALKDAFDKGEFTEIIDTICRTRIALEKGIMH